MKKCNTILSQLLDFFPRYEFKKLVKKHKTEKHARGVTSWDHFVALMFCQLAGQDSLRSIEAGMATQVSRLYHSGTKPVNRSSLSYANARRSSALFEDIFYWMLSKCGDVAPKHKFRFKNPLYSLDATMIELCLSMFDWADYQKQKGAIKLHVKLNHAGYLPSFVVVTTGKEYETHIAPSIPLETGDVVTFDRGYLDFNYLKNLDNKGIYYVTRLRKDSAYKVVGRNEHIGKNILSDHRIKLTDRATSKKYHDEIRKIRVKDPETGKIIVLITNNFKWAASTIAAIYKDRWQIELFFKAIKQQLKIKSFIGTSLNALLSQIWTALITYLLLSYIKFKAKFRWSLYTLICIMPLNLFSRRNLWDWLNDPYKADGNIDADTRQMVLGFG
mgnify:CR=1 FL=1